MCGCASAFKSFRWCVLFLKWKPQDFPLGKFNTSTSPKLQSPYDEGKKPAGFTQGKYPNSVADGPEKISLWSDGCRSNPRSWSCRRQRLSWSLPLNCCPPQAGPGSWRAEAQAGAEDPGASFGGTSCWQGEGSLSAWEGSWKRECRDLGELLRAQVTREAALGKSSLLFPSSPASASCSRTTVAQRAPAVPRRVWNAARLLPTGEGGKGTAGRAWQKPAALASLLSSAGTCKACGQTLVPALLATIREGGRDVCCHPHWPKPMHGQGCPQAAVQYGLRLSKWHYQPILKKYL